MGAPDKRRDMDHSYILSDFRSHQIKLDSEFLRAENLFRAFFSLCLRHAFLKLSVPLNVAKAAINGLIILNLQLFRAPFQS